MPASFIALWGKPSNVEEFDRHYQTAHMEIVRRWPKVQSYTLIRVTGSPTGGEVPYHQVFVATFDTEEDLKEALRSPEVAEAGRDAMDMVRRFGCSLTVLTGVQQASKD